MKRFRFNYTQQKELRDFLYRDDIHDAFFRKITYNAEKKELCIELRKISIIFLGIKKMVFKNDNRWGTNETISSLTIEDCYDTLCLEDQVLDPQKHIYSLFQLFSGNEIHILSEEIAFEENQML